MTDTLGSLGEFEFIRRVRFWNGTEDESVHLGIGDDVAAVSVPPGQHLLATCDCQVEGVHFTLPDFSPQDVGWRLGAVNVSDIAAMGGIPRWALLSVMAIPETSVGFLEQFYWGLHEVLKRYGVCLVGGNTSKASKGLAFDMTMLGTVEAGRWIARSGASPGDAVMVTGNLGDAAAGLRILSEPDLPVGEGERSVALMRHKRPEPRWREGRWLARTGHVRAMMDISDGLLSDLAHLCRASGVGVRIDAASVPVGKACESVACAMGKDPLWWALTGGEDYELLFCVDPGKVSFLELSMLREWGTACTFIGRIVPRKDGIQVRMPDGTMLKAGDVAGGWDHFRGETKGDEEGGDVGED